MPPKNMTADQFDNSYDPQNPHFQTLYASQMQNNTPNNSHITDPSFIMGVVDSQHGRSPNESYHFTNQDRQPDQVERITAINNDPNIPKRVKVAIERNDPVYINQWIDDMQPHQGAFPMVQSHEQIKRTKDLQAIANGLHQSENPYPTRGEYITALGEAGGALALGGGGLYIAKEGVKAIGKYGLKEAVDRIPESPLGKKILGNTVENAVKGGVLGKTMLYGGAYGAYELGSDKLEAAGDWIDAQKSEPNAFADWLNSSPHLDNDG